MNQYKIALIKGDGIGPEIIQEACKILEKISHKFNFNLIFKEYLMGGIAYETTKNPLPD
ncbi:MAG: 3-isopropylmalate dehydrogenase, partial [Helicobacter sp.]|nr:3-isopropylmalate dehydrogenase [Helicobacter sp.]